MSTRPCPTTARSVSITRRIPLPGWSESKVRTRSGGAMARTRADDDPAVPRCVATLHIGGAERRDHAVARCDELDLDGPLRGQRHGQYGTDEQAATKHGSSLVRGNVVNHQRSG